MDTTTIGKRIRKLRLQAELSQRDLVDGTPFSFSYLCRVELGDRNPSEKFLRAIAVKLDTTAHVLEGGKECPHCLHP
jgi:transcriptional regulator with XRE-family HTH domain